MNHLEIEDIGRLIDKNVSKQERKRLFQHLSQCKACLTLYNETLKFMGEEKKSKSLLKFPIPGKIIVSGVCKAISTIFTVKRYRLALVAMLIILSMVPFMVKEFSPQKIKNAQIQYIENKIENIGSPAFFPSGGARYTAVRTGIFIEDLSMLIQTDEKEELLQKISQMLGRELKQLADEKNSLLQELAQLNKKNFAKVFHNIKELIEKQSLTELFQFGRFIGQSIRATFENQIPEQGDIEKFRRIAQKFKLPPGVFKRLSKLKTTKNVKENRDIFIEIEELFFK
jgi:ElaB/YqjD/DUF883 family membrane-anchored ribosome-binding protein